MKKVYLLIAVLLFSSIHEVNAQKKSARRRGKKATYIMQHEVGLNAGISNFQGDFTQSGPFDGLVTINGFTINGTHSMHWIKSRRNRRRKKDTNILNHLMIKSSIGYTQGNFNNLLNSTGDEDLLALSSSGDNGIHTDIIEGRITSETSIISLSSQAEFYFRDLVNYLHQSSRARGRSRRSRSRRYRRSSSRRSRYSSRRRRSTNHKGNVYVAAGIGLNIVNSASTTDLTTDERVLLQQVNGTILPDLWTQEVLEDLDPAFVFSGSFAIGYRYRLARSVDLVAEIKSNLYTSDAIDAINPSNSTNPNFDESVDTAVDYNTNITLGVVYHLF